MNVLSLLLVLVIVAGIWYTVTSVMIYHQMRQRQIKVSFLMFRFLLPKYVHQYKELKVKEDGKAGALYYHWLISICTAAVIVFTAVLIKVV